MSVMAPSGAYPPPRTPYRLSPAAICCTVIWFSVKVPVLSEQMTVVLPNVSTAGSLRMIAWRRAIRETPMASVMVTAAGRPSGIAPTARATAARNISTSGSPRSRPMITVSTARPRMMYRSSRLNCAILRVSGVCNSWASEIRLEILPTSVESPVITTTPAPCPAVTRVEA